MNRKRVVTVRLGAAVLAGSTLLLVGTLAPSLAQDPGASGPAASPAAGVEFDAEITGLQRQHLAEATNLIIEPPKKGCPGGLETHSVDQETNFYSDPAIVDAVAIDDPAWGDQKVALVPHGFGSDFLAGQAPTGEIDLAPLMFSLRTRYEVSRTFADPGTGAMAQPVDFTDPCASEGEEGRTPPPMDCGDRDFLSDVVMLNPEPNTLLPVTGNVPPEAEELYTNCAGGVDMGIGQFVSGDSGQTVTSQAQPLPPLDQFLDPSVPKLEISGSASGHQDVPGQRVDSDLAWTLTFCRMVNGQPLC